MSDIIIKPKTLIYNFFDNEVSIQVTKSHLHLVINHRYHYLLTIKKEPITFHGLSKQEKSYSKHLLSLYLPKIFQDFTYVHTYLFGA
jgi:hypothetical protein